jgi:hypothetical protein
MHKISATELEKGTNIHLGKEHTNCNENAGNDNEDLFVSGGAAHFLD